MSSPRPLRKDFTAAPPVSERIFERWHRHGGALPQNAVASQFGRRDYLIRRLLAVADALSVLLAVLAMVLVSGRAGTTHLLWGLLLVPVWMGLFAVYGLYNRDIKRISHSTVDDIPWILHAVLVACLLTWVYFNLLHIPKLVFSDVLVLGGIATLAMLLLRSLTRGLAIRALGPEKVLFIGDHPMEFLMNKMVAHPEYGLQPVGVVHASTDSLDQAIEVFDADRIVLCEPDLEEHELLALIHRCRELSLKVSVLPQLFSALGPSVEVDDVEGVTVLGINPPVLSRSSRYLKRAFDITGSAVVLVLCAPFAALVAVAIKLDSRGPVFFKQQRIGRGGRPFCLFKFRTMVVGAEQQTAELFEGSEDANWLKLDHDPRITRVGRVLRHASLDELPQFWNILKGEMSLVGPRPLIESEDCQIAGWGRSRLELTPGLTGLWQVLGRTNIPFEEMVKLDYMYVTNWSLWADVRLLLRTFPTVVTRRGAN
ncbi:MAG TPA: sugar transferase [Solirubrobacterales bacterium]|nr:sugar transferase [Solirubrobacterales bacterium]